MLDTFNSLEASDLDMGCRVLGSFPERRSICIGQLQLSLTALLRFFTRVLLILLLKFAWKS